jgi:hypothetical protein
MPYCVPRIEGVVSGSRRGRARGFGLQIGGVEREVGVGSVIWLGGVASIVELAVDGGIGR